MRMGKKLLCGLLCGILILTAFSGCKEKELPAISWEPAPTTQPIPLPEVYAASIAHHGTDNYDFPQNTLECIERCARDGWKMVEFDVRWTKDNIPVLSHREDVLLYGNSSRIYVSKLTYEEIKAFQLYEDVNIRMSKLYDVIDVCKQNGMVAFMELKTHPTAEQLDELIEYLREKDMLDSCVWACFNLDPLLNVIKRDPQARVMLNLSEAKDLQWLETEKRMGKLLDRDGETILAYNYTCLTKMEDAAGYLKGFQDAGCSICLWTIDNPMTIRKYAEVADYIVSDTYTVEKAWYR